MVAALCRSFDCRGAGPGLPNGRSDRLTDHSAVDPSIDHIFQMPGSPRIVRVPGDRARATDMQAIFEN